MFDLTQHITSFIYRQGNGSIFRSLKRFLEEDVGPLYLLFLKLSFVIEKFLCYQDHHPTGSNHISNELENMQITWFLGHMDSLLSLKS
jgi:hypothetical protein